MGLFTGSRVEPVTFVMANRLTGLRTTGCGSLISVTVLDEGSRGLNRLSDAARPWLLCVRREPLNLGLEAIGFSQALVSLLIPLCTLAGCFQVLA
jgi:hypothetical protein